MHNENELRSDIYGFSMVVLNVRFRSSSFTVIFILTTFSFRICVAYNQILTGDKPFASYPRDFEIITAVKRGQRPDRPNHTLIHRALDDKLWDIIARCWAQDPEDRPTASQVLRELEDLRRLPDLDVPDLTLLVRLNENIQNVMASGGFGDVRRAMLHAVGPVALKTLVVKGQAQPELRITKVRPV